MSEILAGLAIAILGGLLIGYAAGVEYPPCCPGAARSCDTSGGGAGVQYCREHAFGWEPCQRLSSDAPYPQALWRGKGER